MEIPNIVVTLGEVAVFDEGEGNESRERIATPEAKLEKMRDHKFKGIEDIMTLTINVTEILRMKG